jgi:hypothetical protein
VLSYRCVAEVALNRATLLHKNVVNLAFARTKDLRSNTRAQGYEDVENEELSAKRFSASGIFWDYYLMLLSATVSRLRI